MPCNTQLHIATVFQELQKFVLKLDNCTVKSVKGDVNRTERG